MKTIPYDDAMSGKIALAAILEAWSCEESLSHEQIDEILDDTRKAYKALCSVLEIRPDYEV